MSARSRRQHRTLTLNAIDIAAIVVAAGRGTRAGLDVPKQYALLGGRPVLRRTLEALTSHPALDAILVVIGPDDAVQYHETARELPKLLAPVVGGATRQQSVRNGLEALATMAPGVSWFTTLRGRSPPSDSSIS
jgi:2-C-methyl-D-erythritol 4-phosphate cytidylyltransferase/2-C-methyl-D-erythritol 2,4-cyclodiphosphate synthase